MSFVGPFTLTGELLPLLQANAPARCVNVVSAGFKMWKTDPFQDLQSTQRYVSGDVYAHAKLLNVLASLALARRLPADQGTVHPRHTRAPRHGLDPDDPVDDLGDDPGVPAGLAPAAGGPAAPLPGAGRPAR